MTNLTELLGKTYDMFKKNIQLMLKFGLITTVVMIFAELALFFDYTRKGIDYMGEVINAVDPLKIPNPSVLGSIAVLILAIIAGLITWTFMVKIYGIITKKKYSIEDSRNILFSRFWALVGTGIMTVIFLLGLYILLIIPGLIFSFYWIFSHLAVLFREKSGLEALKYSKELVMGNWWKTVGYLFVVGIITGVIVGGVDWILNAALAPTQFAMYFAITAITTFVTYLASFFSMAFTINYFLALEKEKGL